MDKEQALDYFWNSFGIPAFDENTVPEDKRNIYPRITYEVATDSLDKPVALSASLWDRSNSWTRINRIKNRIAEFIGAGGRTDEIDGGAMWIQRAEPFSQRGSDPDDSVRRYNIHVVVEFFTEN